MAGVLGRGIVVAAGALALASGCDASLPEPESPGAQLYARRCGGCHRLYAPKLLKLEMWKVTLQRMQGELVRRGFPPLRDDEHELLLDYLSRHAG